MNKVVIQKNQSIFSNATPLVFACLMISACGGGHGGSSGQTLVTPPSNTTRGAWQLGRYDPAHNYADLCKTPRYGIDPATGLSYIDKLGSESYEKLWLRSVSHEAYLWPEDLADLNPDDYQLLPYFDQLKSHAQTASGKDKDRFHFYESSADVYEHFELGQSQSYGVEWDKIDGIYTVLYVQPNSPAEVAGVHRGMTLASIDSVAVAMMTADTLYAKLFPESPQTHVFALVPQSGGGAKQCFINLRKFAGTTRFPGKNTERIARGDDWLSRFSQF